MAHGSGSDDTIEPNLTPLLDLVLQLLMLFMICGNYASESNDPVTLARSQTAKQLADTETARPGDKEGNHEFLFLTVKPYYRDSNNGDLAAHIAPESRDFLLAKYGDGDAYVIVPGHDAMKPGDELLVWLQEQYKDLSEKNNGQVTTPVVIRPAADMDYAAVYRILRLCKDAHFTDLKVRALIAKGVKD